MRPRGGGAPLPYAYSYGGAPLAQHGWPQAQGWLSQAARAGRRGVLDEPPDPRPVRRAAASAFLFVLALITFSHAGTDWSRKGKPRLSNVRPARAAYMNQLDANGRAGAPRVRQLTPAAVAAAYRERVRASERAAVADGRYTGIGGVPAAELGDDGGIELADEARAALSAAFLARQPPRTELPEGAEESVLSAERAVVERPRAQEDTLRTSSEPVWVTGDAARGAHPGLARESAQGSGGAAAGSLSVPRRHKLAVLVPYRDRESMVDEFMHSVPRALNTQNIEHEVFFVEQADRRLFNRGALLNAGVAYIESLGEGFDYVAVHDVDTLPTVEGGVLYAYPSGDRPVHLTPPGGLGAHPHVTYEDFFGGNALWTLEQLRGVNGFGRHFWGWGKEDDNMRERLNAKGLWPPQRPTIADGGRSPYWQHVTHRRAGEVREVAGQFTLVDPKRPYKDGVKLVNAQDAVYKDLTSGLDETQTVAEILSADAFHGATRLRVQLACDQDRTPHCEMQHPG